MIFLPCSSLVLFLYLKQPNNNKEKVKSSAGLIVDNIFYLFNNIINTQVINQFCFPVLRVA